MGPRPQMPGRIVLATRNAGKAREIREVLRPLAVEVTTLAELDPKRRIGEPAETADTFAGNARRKARDYARATGGWALADDSGLVVDALDGAPGTRSARYAAEQAGPHADRRRIDQANNARLLAELADVPDGLRAARFVCHLALSDGREILLEATGALEGRIARAPAGCNGFGYDPLFFIPSAGCTAAQLAPEEKNRLSHRGQAVREFARRLGGLLGR